MARAPDPDDAPTPGSPAWWERRRARPRRASALTAERIVAGAVVLLDREGLEAFSMRRLADALGTAAGSLYRHFESREAVLVAVHDHLIGAALDLEHSGGDPVERVISLAHAQWRLLTERPYLAVIWTGSEQLGPNALRARERALQAALDVGLSPDRAARAYLLVLHHTIAFAALRQRLGGRTPAERAATEAFFGALPEQDFPAVRSVAGDLAHVTVDEEFELGLRAILAGLLAADTWR
jgi:AcrR family transcriptional regulator